MAANAASALRGIVMALYGLWMTNPDPSVIDIETALQGNLCRCTGYEPIVKAALAAAKAGGQALDALNVERETVRTPAFGMAGQRGDVRRGDQRAIVPMSVDDLAATLGGKPRRNPRRRRDRCRPLGHEIPSPDQPRRLHRTSDEGNRRLGRRDFASEPASPIPNSCPSFETICRRPKTTCCASAAGRFATRARSAATSPMARRSARCRRC